MPSQRFEGLFRKTQNVRNGENLLFLTRTKPFKAVSMDTITTLDLLYLLDLHTDFTGSCRH